MKFQYKKALTIAALASLVTAFTGCKKDFFDLKDRNGMDSRIWDNEGAIQFLLNGTYDVVMPEFPYELAANNVLYASDEDRFSSSDAIMRKAIGVNGSLIANDVKFVAQKYQGNNKGDNKYFDIARCNNAIKEIPGGTLSQDAKNKLRGQFFALRALSYFELTRVYGGVPLVLEPQDPDNIKLEGRAKAAECFKAVVNDLDSAMVLLNGVTWNDANERGKFTRASVAALKGRVLLYWASPQFNPTNDPAHPYDAKRWQTAYLACKDAYDICKASGNALMPNYSDIFLKEGAANPEAIIVRSYSNKVAKRGQAVEGKLRPVEEGGSPSAFLPTLNMVNAYSMKDGVPIDKASSFTYDPSMFWVNRDPRLDATIAYNGSAWKLSGLANRRQWNYTGNVTESSPQSFYMKRFADPDLAKGAVSYSNDFGGNGMDWIELRFAEVIMNYAECANEIGNLAEAKDLVKQIRIRAGIVQGTKNYGLDLATSRTEMSDLIMRERMVEFAFEGKRGYDLRRTRRFHLLSGQMQVVTWATKSTALKTELEAITSNGTRFRDGINVNDKATFDKYFTSTINTVGVTGFSIPETYYFYALPSTFMNSSPLLEQTIGWDGGTFDPL
ncbi:MAG: RagB/SusD family nutrient uptake outer membrane protein [Candidatus Pedobacter colombiensis]|uniref:RagB/SusD family nutrient uptake outer membrane protein n=1 Tax=Candidatus Pedobacter colombiensis TaxID=3121371 RepID=A0AAJ5W5V8_9SPHI|nr:RagB/SusD family nutrient uptake outer membrane protein [Pedobacter sp.]WEK17710.1 MAG: RagB/SusD family nutrient uptake outer membrane protein [Pedobacter sp.]